MRTGKITENALKRSVLKEIQTKYKGLKSAAVGSDCAFSKEKKVFSAVCPVSYGISDGAYYAVCKAAGALFCQGLVVDHVTLSVLLPVEFEERALKQIIRDAVAAVRDVGVTYSGGHTETTGAVNRPVLTANAVGYQGGGRALFDEKPVAGQDLVVTRWVGLEGTAMLAKEKLVELSSRYPVPFIEEAAAFKKYIALRQDAEAAIVEGAAAIHDLSQGGVFAGLWEMGVRAGCGMRVDLKKIPIRQETIEICEFFELNPYQLLSGGAMLIAADDGEKLADALVRRGIPAVMIGSLTSGNDRILVNDDEERFLEMPQSDAILTVL